MPSGDRRRGSGMLEMVLVIPPMVFILFSIVELSRGMWNYASLARGVAAGARLAAVRGAGCTTTPNTCGITVGTIATSVAAYARGIPSGSYDVTLVTNSGATTTCSPLSSCLTSTTPWPPSSASDNAKGANVTVTAKYRFYSALSMFWPGSRAVGFGAIYLPASSTQQILF